MAWSCRLIVLAGCVACVPSAWGQRIVGLGAIADVERGVVSGMSADGSVIGGYRYFMSGTGGAIACRWVRETDGSYTREEFGQQQRGRFSMTVDVSDSGSTILMQAWGNFAYHYYSRHTVAPGEHVWTELRPFDGHIEYWIWGLSGDGSHVMGQVALPEGGRAFVWPISAPGTHEPRLLPLLPGARYSAAHDVSADGFDAVGYCPAVRDGSQSAGGPVRWTGARVEELPLPAGCDTGTAYAVSEDGSTVIGIASDMRPSVRGVLWRAGQPVVTLGNLPGTTLVIPYALSADGSVVVGWSRDDRYLGYVSRPFLWTQRTGMLELKQLAGQFGGEFREWDIQSPNSVSADGRTILGSGYHAGAYEGFVLTFPEFCIADFDNDGDATNGGLPDFAVTIHDLLFFLARFEQGHERLDLDDGSNTGTLDGAVDVSDLLYFLMRFEEGC
jgi:uncharacterized membrane protein